MTDVFPEAVKTAEIVKEDVGAITIMGGVHPSILPNETVQHPAIDIVVRGEGEMTMLELVKTLETNQGARALGEIKGITFKVNGRIVSTPQRPPIENINSLPFPARDLFPFKLYRGYQYMVRRKPSTHIITSRGCPFNCVFCASKTIWGRHCRTRSPDNVVNEIEHLMDKFHIREVLIYDDTFNVDLSRVEAICDEILSRKLDIIWRAQARVSPIREELLKKMKRAGCWCMYFGVESGVQEILRGTQKGITLEQVDRAFKLTKRVGLRTTAYFMIGLPGDNEATVRQTIKYAKHLDPDFAVFSITTLYPGTELCEMAGNYNLIQSTVYETRDFTKKELEQMLRLALKEFYFRPTYILRRLYRIRSWQEFLSTISAAYSILRS
jgi:radical SAM superfamily enzyme YgiQ (UPF0313 family)